MIAPTAQRELSPAYALTPNPLTGLKKRGLAMSCGTFNSNANRIKLLLQRAKCKPSGEQASNLIDHALRGVVARWECVWRRHGATPGDCDVVAAASNHTGFELDTSQVLAAPWAA